MLNHQIVDSLSILSFFLPFFTQLTKTKLARFHVTSTEWSYFYRFLCYLQYLREYRVLAKYMQNIVIVLVGRMFYFCIHICVYIYVYTHKRVCYVGWNFCPHSFLTYRGQNTFYRSILQQLSSRKKKEKKSKKINSLTFRQIILIYTRTQHLYYYLRILCDTNISEQLKEVTRLPGQTLFVF